MCLLNVVIHCCCVDNSKNLYSIVLCTHLPPSPPPLKQNNKTQLHALSILFSGGCRRFLEPSESKYTPIESINPWFSPHKHSLTVSLSWSFKEKKDRLDVWKHICSDLEQDLLCSRLIICKEHRQCVAMTRSAPNSVCRCKYTHNPYIRLAEKPPQQQFEGHMTMNAVIKPNESLLTKHQSIITFFITEEQWREHLWWLLTH